MFESTCSCANSNKMVLRSTVLRFHGSSSIQFWLRGAEGIWHSSGVAGHGHGTDGGCTGHHIWRGGVDHLGSTCRENTEMTRKHRDFVFLHVFNCFHTKYFLISRLYLDIFQEFSSPQQKFRITSIISPSEHHQKHLTSAEVANRFHRIGRIGADGHASAHLNLKVWSIPPNRYTHSDFNSIFCWSWSVRTNI